MNFIDDILGQNQVSSGYASPEQVLEIVKNDPGFQAQANANKNSALLKAPLAGIVGKPSAELTVNLTGEGLAQAPVPMATTAPGDILRKPGLTMNVLPGIKDTSEIPGVVGVSKASGFYWIVGGAVLGYVLLKRGGYL